MAEWKRASVKISSVIHELSDKGEPLGEPELTEESYPSALFCKTSEGIEVEYESVAEGIPDKCAIHIDGRTARMVRTGQVNSELVFEKGKSVSTVYTVSPYSFDMTVRTTALEYDVNDGGAKVRLEYDMCLGGQKRRVKMKIEIRGSL